MTDVLRCTGCYAEAATIRGINRVPIGMVGTALFVAAGHSVCERHYNRLVAAGLYNTPVAAGLGLPVAPPEPVAPTRRRKRTGVRA